METGLNYFKAKEAANVLKEPDGELYHLVIALPEGNLFHEDADYQAFRKEAALIKKKVESWVYHYCFLPRCVHLLLKVYNKPDLFKWLQALETYFGRYCEKKLGRRLPAFEIVWKFQIARESYYLQCGRYIERIPVERGLAMETWQYRYSSARYYCLGDHDELVSRNFLYEIMGRNDPEKQKNYRAFVSFEEPYASLIHAAWTPSISS